MTPYALQSPEADDDGPETPTPRDEQQRTLWKVTQTTDRRIVVIAQECINEPLPDMPDDDIAALHLAKPIINLSWREQPRFEPLRRGEGQMAELIRNFDWVNHPLGAIETWPQARVELVGMILCSFVPMTAYLEKEAFTLYNDAFRQCLGPSKHPDCLGKPAKEVWGEIWHLIEPALMDTLNGIPIKREDQLLFWERLSDGGPNILEVRLNFSSCPASLIFCFCRRCTRHGIIHLTGDKTELLATCSSCLSNKKNR